MAGTLDRDLILDQFCKNQELDVHRNLIFLLKFIVTLKNGILPANPSLTGINTVNCDLLIGDILWALGNIILKADDQEFVSALINQERMLFEVNSIFDLQTDISASP